MQHEEMVMRDPYGQLNPLKTEYVAKLIKEIDFRIKSPLFNDEIEPIPEDKLPSRGAGTSGKTAGRREVLAVR